MRFFLLAVLSTFAYASITYDVMAQAPANAATQERLERIERNVMVLQRQLARGEAPSGSLDEAGLDSPAQIDVRLSMIEEDLKRLRGKIEENEFQLRKVNENLERLQKDTEFRFQEVSTKLAPTLAPAAAPPPQPVEEKSRKSLPANPEDESGGEPDDHPDPVTEPDTSQKETFSAPRDHYNYAFRLLNQTKYDDAAKSFADFTKKYPKDPLVGNAYYWTGETHYIKRDYVNAADSFRQGFEAAPTGAKAADNLLKLAMSLDALKRSKEACVVLEQIVSKFKKSASTAAKAAQEQKRIGCK